MDLGLGKGHVQECQGQATRGARLLLSLHMAYIWDLVEVDCFYLSIFVCVIFLIITPNAQWQSRVFSTLSYLKENMFSCACVDCTCTDCGWS